MNASLEFKPGLSAAADATVAASVKVEVGTEVTVGARSIIGHGVEFRGEGKIAVGDDVVIFPGCRVWSLACGEVGGVHIDGTTRIGNGAVLRDGCVVEWGVTIGEGAEIGRAVTIGPSTSIGHLSLVGNHAVVAAGSKVGDRCRVDGFARSLVAVDMPNRTRLTAEAAHAAILPPCVHSEGCGNAERVRSALDAAVLFHAAEDLGRIHELRDHKGTLYVVTTGNVPVSKRMREALGRAWEAAGEEAEQVEFVTTEEAFHTPGGRKFEEWEWRFARRRVGERRTPAD